MNKILTTILTLTALMLAAVSCEKIFIPAEDYVPKKVLSVEQTARIQDSLCVLVNDHTQTLKSLVDAKASGLQALEPNRTDSDAVYSWDIPFENGKSTTVNIVRLSESNPVPIPVITVKPVGEEWFWTVNGETLVGSDGTPVSVALNDCPTISVKRGQFSLRIGQYSHSIEPSQAWSRINPFSTVYVSDSERVIVWLQNNATLSYDIKGADCFVKYDKVQTAETEGTPLNVVVMGEGYTQDMIDNGTYDRDMHKIIETFFDIEPYTSLRSLFSCYSVQLLSKTRLFDDQQKTALSCSYNGNGMRGRFDKAFAYALRIPEIAEAQEGEPKNIICDATGYSGIRHVKGGLVVIVMMNSRSNQRSGICHLIGDGMCVCAVDREPSENDFRFAVWHEAGGHGFASLADEYQHQKDTAPSSLTETLHTAHKEGFHLNVDTTSDPEKVAWKHLLNDPRYSVEVGVYEGGHCYNYGVWRPSQNSVMRYRDDYTPPYFNAVGREVIYKTAMRLNKGEDYVYDFEDFAAFDEPFRTFIQKYKPL